MRKFCEVTAVPLNPKRTTLIADTVDYLPIPFKALCIAKKKLTFISTQSSQRIETKQLRCSPFRVSTRLVQHVYDAWWITLLVDDWTLHVVPRLTFLQFAGGFDTLLHICIVSLSARSWDVGFFLWKVLGSELLTLNEKLQINKYEKLIFPLQTWSDSRLHTRTCRKGDSDSRCRVDACRPNQTRLQGLS